MCYEFYFNVIFLVVHLQWIVVNTDEKFIIVNLLLLNEMVLLCCDFTVHASRIDKEYKNTLENKLFHTDGITDKLRPSKSSRELKNFYMTLPLIIINRIIDILSPLESSKEFKKITWLCH